MKKPTIYIICEQEIDLIKYADQLAALKQNNEVVFVKDISEIRRSNLNASIPDPIQLDKSCLEKIKLANTYLTAPIIDPIDFFESDKHGKGKGKGKYKKPYW